MSETPDDTTRHDSPDDSPDDLPDDLPDDFAAGTAVGAAASTGAIEPVTLPNFATNPIDPRVDHVLDEGAWSYLEPDAHGAGPTTSRGEPAYLRAYAILDGLDAPGGLLAPSIDCTDLSYALIELTQDGATYPEVYLDVDEATDATSADAALADAVTALNELITTSDDLTHTLRLIRSRSLVRDVAAAVRAHPTTPPHLGAGSAPNADTGRPGPNAQGEPRTGPDGLESTQDAGGPRRAPEGGEPQ